MLFFSSHKINTVNNYNLSHFSCTSVILYDLMNVYSKVFPGFPQCPPSSSRSSFRATPSATGSSCPVWCGQATCPSPSTGRRMENPLMPVWTSLLTKSTSPAPSASPTSSECTTARTHASPETTPPSSSIRASSSSGVKTNGSVQISTTQK